MLGGKKKGKKGKLRELDSSEEDEMYKDLIAGSSAEEGYGSESDGDEDKEKAHIEEMRRKLLGGLDNIGNEGSKYRRNKDLQGSEDDEDMDVNFGIGFGEDIGQKLLDTKKEKKEKSQMSDFQKWQEKKADKKRDKKKEQKLKEKDRKLQGSMSEKELIEHNKKKAQLEMLIDGSKSSKSAETVVSKDDSRFKTSDSAFAVDPTHKEYKKVKEGHNKVVKRSSGAHHYKKR